MPDTQDVATTGVAEDELKQFVERAETVQEEIDDARSLMKDLKAELKGRGFDVKAFNTILRLRKIERAERQEQEAIVELYKAAVGLD